MSKRFLFVYLLVRWSLICEGVRTKTTGCDLYLLFLTGEGDVEVERGRE